MKKMVLIAFVMLFLFATTVTAKILPDGGVTIDEIASIITEKGYKAEIKEYDNGNQKIISAAEGYKYVIYFYSLSETGRAKDIQFYMALDLKEGISLAKVCKWNEGYRFARMYRDDEEDPVLEMDLDVEHGCTTEAVDNNLERWFSVLNAFDKFIFEK